MAEQRTEGPAARSPGGQPGQTPGPVPPGGDSGPPRDRQAGPNSTRDGRGGGGGQAADTETERGEGDERSPLPGPDSVQDYARAYIGAEQATGVRVDGSVHGGAYGFVGTLNSIVVPSAGSRVAVGTVERRLLDKVRSVLVPPGVLEPAMRILRDRRILVLQGRAHWGKASLALWLLDQVGEGGGPLPEVCAIAPEVSLRELPEGFFDDQDRPGCRYVVDTLASDAAGAIRLPVLRALCDQLADHDGHLVITVDSRTPMLRTELRDYLVDCQDPPAPEAVLRANLRWRLDGKQPPEHLLELPWVRDELRQGALPGYLDQLAEVLAGMATGRWDEAEARAFHVRQVRLRVEEWFESHRGARERCLMVAAAVLNGASYHEVADAAERLRAMVDPPDADGDDPRQPRWELASNRHQLAEDVGARVVSRRRPTTIGRSPSEVLELEDLAVQREVLEHVWEGHDLVRGALLDWLEQLGQHHDLDVRGRAAAAVGALCRKDLPYLHSRLLLDWATSPRVAARVSAAVALDVLAGEEELAKQVRALLRQWVRHGPGSRLAWTATAAYGFRVGQRWPRFALEDLRLVIEGAPHHGWVASRSLANLCQAGRAAVVLDKLADWAAVEDPRQASERVLRAFAYTLQTGVVADALAAGAGTDRDGVVPTLLRQAADEPPLRQRVGRLWKRAFDWTVTRDEAVDALHYWVGLADDRPEVAQALDVVASAELLRGSPQYQEELAHVLRKWAADPRRESTTARRYLHGIGQEVGR